MGEVISPPVRCDKSDRSGSGRERLSDCTQDGKTSRHRFCITMACYFVIGRQYTGGAETQLDSDIGSLLDSIKGQFSISLLELLPMALMAACILLKFPAIPSMFAGILCGLFEALFLQQIDIEEVLNVSYNGFLCQSGNPLVDDLLSAGGMNEMLYSISIIVIAMGFGGIMQHTKQIETLLTPLINRIKSKGSLGLVTVLSCVCMNVILPDQYLGISLPGQMYEKDICRQEYRPIRSGGDAAGRRGSDFPLDTMEYLRHLRDDDSKCSGGFLRTLCFLQHHSAFDCGSFRIHQKEALTFRNFIGTKARCGNLLHRVYLFDVISVLLYRGIDSEFHRKRRGLLHIQETSYRLWFCNFLF